MKCIKLPVFVYYIAYFGYDRQENKEAIFIHSKKGKIIVSSLLKKSPPYGGCIGRVDMQYMRWK